MNGGNLRTSSVAYFFFFFKFRLEENVGALRVGGWTPVKWRNRLITEWRQTPFLSSSRKRDSSRCKKPLRRCSFSPRSDKWQILHLNQLYILMQLLWRWTCLLHQRADLIASFLSSSADSSNPFFFLRPVVWNPGLLICCWLLWRWNKTAVRKEEKKDPLAAGELQALPPCL